MRDFYTHMEHTNGRDTEFMSEQGTKGPVTHAAGPSRGHLELFQRITPFSRHIYMYHEHEVYAEEKKMLQLGLLAWSYKCKMRKSYLKKNLMKKLSITV